MMCGDNTPEADNLVLQELEKQTNTKINMIYVPNADYDTKLSTMIAAGTVPDIFYCNLADAADFAESGIIANVEDLLNEVAPNVIEDTKEIIHDASVNKDGIYLVPCAAKGNVICVNIRTDWLKNLGLDMPTDLESFAEVMHAFTYDDPNQNGVDDTYGYAFSLTNLAGSGPSFSNIFGAYGIPKGQAIELDDGTVTSWVKHPEFLNAMKYIKKLVDDGVCEPDYVTIPNMDLFGKLWTGVAGCIEWSCVAVTNNWMPSRYVEDPVPTFDYAVIEGPDGIYGSAQKYADVTQGWVFSSSCANLEGAARIANYCMSAEGSDLLTLGVEDVMYKWTDKEAGKVEYLNEYADQATHRAAGGYCYEPLFKPVDNAQFRTLNAQTRQGSMDAWERGIDWAYIYGVSEVRIDCGADMDQVISEMIAELLTTDEAKMQEVYDSYIEEWENVGGSDWEEEATQLWKEQNQ